MADLIQPVIGFRAFCLENNTGPSQFFAGHRFERLWSAGYGGYEWRPGVNQAECRASAVAAYMSQVPPGWDAHEAPDPECGCGLYAHHRLLVEVAGSHVSLIHGAIAAWGRIEVHAIGFRAQYAKIVALGMAEIHVLGAPSARQQIKRLAGRYDADCVPLIDLEEAAYEHGITVPEELLPEPEEAPEYAIAGLSPGAPVPGASGLRGGASGAHPGGSMHYLGAAVRVPAGTRIVMPPGGRFGANGPRERAVRAGDDRVMAGVQIVLGLVNLALFALGLHWWKVINLVVAAVMFVWAAKNLHRAHRLEADAN